MTFEQLNLSEQLLRAVKAAGYTQPSPIQAKAIPVVLSGQDLLGCAQTGTGKTAAFGLPMLQQLAERPAKKAGAIRALILTPTRELALQIGESFAQYGKYLKLRHAVIFGGVGQQPQIDTLKRGVDILVACPGRLNDLIGQGYVDLQHVEFFVLDEADQMLDMGFIHDVKKVMRKLPEKAQRQTLLFSATMPKEIEQLAAELLYQPAFVKVDPVSSTVERIQQSIYYVEKGNKKMLLPYLIQNLQPPVTNALVFSRTKYGADKIAKDLTKHGIPAVAIHGNKSQNARVTALESFKAGKTRVLVATDIAARGIDISELAYVFNYDLPEVPETYVHRIGRTARAGADGHAVSFCCSDEQDLLKAIEKLNRKKIQVVSGHPWDGVPAPAKGPAITPKGTKVKPARERAKPVARAEKTVRAVNRNEGATMEEQELRNAPQGENLSASAKRRRRRRRSKTGATQNTAQNQEKAVPQQGKAKPQNKQQAKPTAPAQPKFDPHFLSAAAASQVRGNAQPKAERQPQNKQQPVKAKNQPKNQPRREKTAQQQKPVQQPKAAKAEPKKNMPKVERTAQNKKNRGENPGLMLISRRPPQQKFANFEDYMAARGGATAPVEDYADD